MHSESLLPAYEKLNAGRGFVILPRRTMLEFSGTTRNAFVHRFCTADVNSMREGDLKETFILDQRGKTIGFGNLIQLAERTCFSMADSSFSQGLHDHFERYIIREDVRVENRSDQFSAIFVADCAAIPCQSGHVQVPAGTATVVEIQSVETMIAHADFAGNGLLLIVPMAQLDSVSTALANNGLEPCPLDALHMRRIESGTPWFGMDIDDTNLPQEIHRDATAISFNKGCYLGQETVAKIDAIGHVNRFLVGIKFVDSTWNGVDRDVLADGKSVGALRSRAWSPKLNAWLAMACVKRNYSAPDTNLMVGKHRASVVVLPIRSS